MSEKSNNDNKTASPKMKWVKRILFTLLVMAFLTVAVELLLQATKTAMRNQVVSHEKVDSCNNLVFLTIGDSFTYGLYSKGKQSYPMQFADLFSDYIPDYKASVINIGVPGTSSSEGIQILKAFFENPDRVFPDFAFIMYGMNNRWNLHNATIWDWEGQLKKDNYFEFITSKLQLSKFFKLAQSRSKQDMDPVINTGPVEFRKMLDEHGWSMFFKTYNDPILKNWIREDLTTLVKMVQDHGIIPVIVSYPVRNFPELNQILTTTATKLEVKYLNVERPIVYWVSNKMLSPRDKFHLNPDGNRMVASITVEKFRSTFDDEALKAIMEKKKASGRCQP